MAWVVMAAQRWSALTTSLGFDVSDRVEAGMPSRWIPVFEAREDAEAWAEGRYAVREVMFAPAEAGHVEEATG